MKHKLSIFVLLALISFVAAPAVLAKDEETLDRGPLTKITFIHYKKGTARAVKPPRGGGPACYGYLASGAKWKTTEDYLINPTNSNLDQNFVKNAVDLGVAAWENAAGAQIFANSYLNTSAVYQTDSVDGKNVVVFGANSDPNVIAVTNVWGYFYGSPKTRELVEWDMQFNTDYTWGDALANSSVMDLQNIATHELGHGAGMKDLYDTTCSQETMYGYADYGQTNKRTLEAGDIQGISQLY